MNKAYFKDKKILITGNTGFKGTWLTMYLLELGAKIFGISNANYPNDIAFQQLKLERRVKQYYIDIVQFAELKKIIDVIQPDVVFHLAAQSLTYKAYQNPLHTFQINGMGTANLLECFRTYERPCDIVVITSDKCYKNNEWVWGYRENDVLAGVDPYSASKSVAEIIFQSYYQTYFKNHPFVKVASARAGNVIGGGDWNENRIIPDAIRAWRQKESLAIRSPKATRPWNFILDVVHGYALLASLLEKNQLNGESFNFGPTSDKELSVLDLIKQAWVYWNDKSFQAYKIAENTSIGVENTFLKLNIDKANSTLNWQSYYNMDEMLESTIQWYLQSIHHPSNIEQLSINLIQNYLSQID